eukprot:14755053-Alexandrium_andersonii.AAC.1
MFCIRLFPTISADRAAHAVRVRQLQAAQWTAAAALACATLACQRVSVDFYLYPSGVRRLI